MSSVIEPAAENLQLTRQLLATVTNHLVHVGPSNLTEIVAADVIITVTRFRNIFNPKEWDKTAGLEGMCCSHELRMPRQSRPWVYLKQSGFQPIRGKQVIRISAPEVVLRVSLTAPEARAEAEPEHSDSYHPVGVAFSRIDPPLEPKAVLLAPAQRPHSSPFSDLVITPSAVQFKVTPLHGQRGGDGAWASYITYKFWIFVQSARHGTIGIIDPYEEIVNPP